MAGPPNFMVSFSSLVIIALAIAFLNLYLIQKTKAEAILRDLRETKERLRIARVDICAKDKALVDLATYHRHKDDQRYNSTGQSS